MPRLQHWSFVSGLIIVGMVLIAALIGPWLTGHDAFAQDLNARLVPPVWMEGGSTLHLLGTDQLGREPGLPKPQGHRASDEAGTNDRYVLALHE